MMDTFDPVKYSIEENTFLLENVGKPPIVALNGLSASGVNAKAVRPVLQEVYDREQLRTHEKVEWVGIEAVKERITDYLKTDSDWERQWRVSRGRVPRYPSMYVKDSKGKYHLGASGSDSDYPKHFIKHGERVPFELNLDELITDEPVVATSDFALVHDTEKHRIECPICSHAESYKTDSRSSYNAARARMSRHLKSSSDESSAHRELWTVEFGA
jgi:hypothetical protein